MKTNHNIFRGTFFFLIFLLRVRVSKINHFSFSDSKKANLKFVDYSHFFFSFKRSPQNLSNSPSKECLTQRLRQKEQHFESNSPSELSILITIKI